MAAMREVELLHSPPPVGIALFFAGGVAGEWFFSIFAKYQKYPYFIRLFALPYPGEGVPLFLSSKKSSREKWSP